MHLRVVIETSHENVSQNISMKITLTIQIVSGQDLMPVGRLLNEASWKFAANTSITINTSFVLTPVGKI